ncbi:hypothetical protein A3SI_10144 [Nitritalea halalkaliphila LW7]|uniref:Uncharacterized protein n=1 Tax=Nitritalea halalkaliphila LW7 TaxID=1189621 RepID=I5C3I3_9BACT|nr:PQQ-binding-like beta-propeller repeat protein [Nitritalea halalkaliphila]EIM76385.1 hypothetical protein A3SI_10144 [Nitritalea halalkaliphila LW7]
MAGITVEKLHTLTGHNDCIYTVVAGAESHAVYTADGNGMVVYWDLRQPDPGKLVAKVPNSIYALTVDKAGKLLYLGQNFEGIHVIDLERNNQIWSIKVTNSAIFDLFLDENLLYIATGDGVLIVLDIQARAVKKHIKISEKSLRTLAVSEKYVAIGDSEHALTVVERGSFAPVKRLEGAHKNSIFTLKFSPCGQYLVSGSRDAHLKFWDAETFEPLNAVVAHMYAINSLAFHPEGQFFVSGSMDKSVKVWQLEGQRLLKVIDKARHAGHGTSINKVLWTGFDDQVVSVSDDRSVSVWKIAGLPYR